MAIAFHSVTCAPLRNFDAAAPDCAVIGIVGENGSGASRLLRLAAGLVKPVSGTVQTSGPVRFLGPDDDLDVSPAAVLLLDQTMARQDALSREKTAVALDRLRRAGSTILLASHQEDLLHRVADEVWWLRAGQLAGRGDPQQILNAYRQHVAAALREWGESTGYRSFLQDTSMTRRGDGRAAILNIQTIGENGRETMVLTSGELAVVKVKVRFRDAVTDPVIGIMIRARIGLNVYGTNTELERLPLGPRRAGDTIEVTFAFRCQLCPGEYTLTAASHDPDGVWHDWLEDAVAFSVSDSRYTAGVANLRAQVSFTLSPG